MYVYLSAAMTISKLRARVKFSRELLKVLLGHRRGQMVELREQPGRVERPSRAGLLGQKGQLARQA